MILSSYYYYYYYYEPLTCLDLNIEVASSIEPYSLTLCCSHYNCLRLTEFIRPTLNPAELRRLIHCSSSFALTLPKVKFNSSLPKEMCSQKRNVPCLFQQKICVAKREMYLVSLPTKEMCKEKCTLSLPTKEMCKEKCTLVLPTKKVCK